MSDDKSSFGWPDRDRINLEHEVSDWESLSVVKEQLRHAVQVIGSKDPILREYLRFPRAIGSHD